MRKIPFILLINIIVVAVGQQQPNVFIQNQMLTQNQSIPPVIFQKPEWNSVQDFALYGWVDLSKDFYNFAQLVRLSANKINDQGDNNMLDRVLGIQIFQLQTGEKQVNFTTYDITTHDPYVEQCIVLTQQDIVNPVFIYYSYNSSLQKTYALVYINESKQLFQEQFNIKHSTSDFYQIFINQHNYFVGNVICLSLINGSINLDDIKNSQYYQNCNLPVIVETNNQSISDICSQQEITLASFYSFSNLDLKNLIFQKSEWNKNQDFSVYGWINISQLDNGIQNIFSFETSISCDGLIYTILNLSIQDNIFKFQTSNYNSLTSDEISIPQEQFLNQWIFVYQSYSRFQMLSFGLIYIPAINQQFIIEIQPVYHAYFKRYKFTLDRQFNSFKADIKNLRLAYGDCTHNKNDIDKLYKQEDQHQQ